MKPKVGFVVQVLPLHMLATMLARDKPALKVYLHKHIDYFKIDLRL